MYDIPEKKVLIYTWPRLAGTVFLTISIAIAYWQLYLPIEKVQHSPAPGEVIRVSPELVLFSILFFLLGISLLLLGPRARFIFSPAPGATRKYMYAALVVTFAIGGIIYFVMQNFLEHYGFIIN